MQTHLIAARAALVFSVAFTPITCTQSNATARGTCRALIGFNER